jgi:hypothetical protein
VTAEVLREIKTVRQFAMEGEETSNYARSGLGRQLMVSPKRLVVESPWLQFTSECQRF